MTHALTNAEVRDALRLAWQESKPGATDACEQGGFILRRSDGSVAVRRWPHGEQDQIAVPEHSGGRFQEMLIVATFHTHPNTGSEYQQEPSPTDIRAVRDDPELRHPEYEGEYVISQARVYLIRPEGLVAEVGTTGDIL